MDKETLIKDMMHQATHDAPLFRTYDDDYDVIDRDQVMRCLANLDEAIYDLNQYAYMSQGITYHIDAIFSALTIMQTNLKKAVDHEAEEALKSKREMDAIGGKK